MAPPPNDPLNAILKIVEPKSLENQFELSHGRSLSFQGTPLLSQVPTNVTFKPFDSVSRVISGAPTHLLHRVRTASRRGGFLGFSKQGQPSDSLSNSLGKLQGRDFLSVFRFKTWWSTMWVGKSGSDLQMETQWVLINVPEVQSYVIIVPIIEGGFRSALNPGQEGRVVISAESGSSQVKAAGFDSIAYVHGGENPYTLMTEAFSAIRVHLNTFRLLEEKKIPNLANKFGWCTWDAFYLTVDPAGVFHGLKELAEGGVSPRFVIVDDGWQSVNLDGDNPAKDAGNLVLGGYQMTARLYRFQESEKFRGYRGGSILGQDPLGFDPRRPKALISKAIEIERAEKAWDKAVLDGAEGIVVRDLEATIRKLKEELDEIFSAQSNGESNLQVDHDDDENYYGMRAFTSDLRAKFKGLDDIYVWHALSGAWGGVRPNATHLNSKIVPCKPSKSLDGTMNDLAVVKIVEGGIGLVDPSQASDFYDSMHSYLAKVGVTGVKVDVIHSLEYVCEEYGGRVELAKAYYKGLSESLVKNFNGSGLISSMQQCNDFFFLGTHQISMGRVGDDFWFQDPNGDPMGVYWLQGVHMIHCAYNSMWMGQIIQPDWDMFQSDHLCAKFHAGSRAICGGPVYVSDSVGGHDFDLLNKLVFPDGTIPNCLHFALPTRDCLFINPLFDNKSLLKIWNFNKYGGVIGAFNCQGAGWDPKEQRIKGHPECYKPMSGSVHVTQIEWDQNKDSMSEIGKAEEYVVYLNQAERFHFMTPKSDPIHFTIKPSSFEIFTFVPIKKLGHRGIKFAPIGLTNMFNSGGTVQELDYKVTGPSPPHDDQISAHLKLKGEGDLLVYSSVAPKKCVLNGFADVDFKWSSDGKLTLNLPWVEENLGVSDLVFIF